MQIKVFWNHNLIEKFTYFSVMVHLLKSRSNHDRTTIVLLKKPYRDNPSRFVKTLQLMVGQEKRQNWIQKCMPWMNLKYRIDQNCHLILTAKFDINGRNIRQKRLVDAYSLSDTNWLIKISNLSYCFHLIK